MARSYPMQNSFNAGEISPRLSGRTDIAKYSSGAKEIVNLIVQSQGGLKRRPGTRFVFEVKNSAIKTRLIPFIVSTVQAYVLEFSNNLVRFYKDEAIIKSGGNPVELVTTYTTAEIAEMTFTPTVDALYIAHTAHPTAKITRTSDTAWDLSDIDFQDGPYLNENNTATTMNPGAATGTGIALMASAVTGINDGDGFLSTDIGRLFSYSNGTARGWAEIVGHTDTLNVTIDIKHDFPVFTPQTGWRLGAFGSATDLLYPAVCVFHEQRFWVGANPGATQTVYGSVIAEFETFSPTELETATEDVLDDSGINYTIAADQENNIRWMASTRTMLVGTSGGIWPVQATTQLEPITPTNIQIKRSDVSGVAEVRPTHVDDVSVFISTTKRQARSVGYVGEKDTYIAEDLTLLADHITESGVDEIAYAREPSSIVWGVRNDGVLLGLTYVTAQQVFAWHRHILGGSFGTGDAVVESVAVIPAPTGDPSSTGRTNIPHDQVWLIVKRTIGGATVRYVEFMEDDFSDTDVLENAYFVDSGVTYNSGAADGVSALAPHLVGETAQLIANGAAHPDVVVAATGSVTFNAFYTKVHVGLYAKAQIDTLNIEPGASSISGAGSSQGRLKRIPTATLRFDRSLGGEACASELDNNPIDEFTGTGANTALQTIFEFVVPSDLVVTRIVTATAAETTMALGTDYTVTGGQYKTGIITPVDGATDFPTTVTWQIQRVVPQYDPILFRSSGDDMDNPPPLFTGDKIMALECGWSRVARMSFRQTQPLPWNLTAIIPNVELSRR